MTTHMPPLRTERLTVRAFVLEDLDAAHRILDLAYVFVGGEEGALTREERRRWLEWSILAAEQQGNLFQPPLGDRAIARRTDDEVVGICGLTAAMVAAEQIAGLARGPIRPQPYLSPEIGLYYQIAPEHRRQGYAAEAAQALITYGFEHMSLSRIVATTTHDNVASIGVMRRLDMRVESNPFPVPPWLQVVGVLENPAARVDV